MPPLPEDEAWLNTLVRPGLYPRVPRDGGEWVERLKPRAAPLAAVVSTGLISGFSAGMILALLADGP